MGHLTFTAQQAEEVRVRALRACAALGLAPF